MSMGSLFQKLYNMTKIMVFEYNCKIFIILPPKNTHIFYKKLPSNSYNMKTKESFLIKITVSKGHEALNKVLIFFWHYF